MYKEENEKMVAKSSELMECCESVPVDFMVNLKENDRHKVYDQNKVNLLFFL